MIKRDVSMDIFKGILTMLMVICHILQFFSTSDFSIFVYYVVGLITFSGFMFSYGYVSYTVYISKKMDRKVFRRKIMKGFGKTIIAFYICAIFSAWLVDNNLISTRFLDILLIKEVPKYCEYLLSFSIMYLVIYIFKDLFNKMSNKMIVFLIVVSLLSTFIDYSYIRNLMIGTIIGTNQYTCFPILQYLCYYLLGFYMKKNEIIFNKKICFLTLIGTLIFILKYFSNQGFEYRFPPTIYWILGGAGLVYCLFLLAKSIKDNKYLYVVQKIGQNTLSYLVISNLLFFIVNRLEISLGFFIDTYNLRILIYILLFIVSIFVGYIYNYFIDKVKGLN